MNSQIVKGVLWTARKIENHYILSLKDEANIIDALTDFISHEKFTTGKISGIGILEEITLRFLDPNLKKHVYTRLSKPTEIQHISGNISETDGKILLHLDVTLEWKNGTLLSGQMVDARVYGCTEFFFYSLETKPILPENDKKAPDFHDVSQWSFN